VNLPVSTELQLDIMLVRSPTYTATAASVVKSRGWCELGDAGTVAVESVSLNQYFQCMIRSSPAPSVTSETPVQTV